MFRIRLTVCLICVLLPERASPFPTGDGMRIRPGCIWPGRCCCRAVGDAGPYRRVTQVLRIRRGVCVIGVLPRRAASVRPTGFGDIGPYT